MDEVSKWCTRPIDVEHDHEPSSRPRSGGWGRHHQLDSYATWRTTSYEAISILIFNVVSFEKGNDRNKMLESDGFLKYWTPFHQSRLLVDRSNSHQVRKHLIVQDSLPSARFFSQDVISIWTRFAGSPPGQELGGRRRIFVTTIDEYVSRRRRLKSHEGD